MPACVRIPEGKHRYTLTLTITTVNRVHAFLGKHGLPKAVLSTMVDEYLTASVRTWEEMELLKSRKGDTTDVGEFFQILGKIISEKKSDQVSLL